MDSTKPKQQLSEDRLRKLAAARVKALEQKKKIGELNRAKAAQKKNAFQKEYDELVLGAKQQPAAPAAPPVEETEEDIYPQPPQPAANPPEEAAPKRRGKQAANTDAPVAAAEPDYRQLYYKHKLENLQSAQQQQQFAAQYSQLPASYQAADIARHTLKSKADKAVLDRVYRDLFGI